VVLIDELNRASPKVQSAFLQVMQEREVTIENETLGIESPFMVVATQLPLGELGTYPLTSVQIDRFAYRVELRNPSMEDEVRVLGRVDLIESGLVMAVISREEVLGLISDVHKVHVEPAVMKYIVEVVQDIRMNRYVRLGPSPRASIWLYNGCRAMALLRERKYVTPDDVKHMVPYVVPHRVELNQEARFMEVGLSSIIEETLARVPVPKGLD
jgi:MoxR-like ATPase